ncbi:MAG: YciI family protein [Ignavibacteria bacterium]
MTDSTRKEKPLFIYKLTLTEEYRNPAKWTDAAFIIVDDHAEFFNELGNQGLLIFAGRTILDPDDKDLFGIAVIQAETLEEARRIMAPDPVIKNKIMKCAIFPFSMKIRYFNNLE